MSFQRSASRARYATIGWLVTRFGWPLARRAMRRRVTSRVRGGTSAAGSHPGRTSLAVGAALGAAGWFVARRWRGGSELGPLDDAGRSVGTESEPGTIHQAGRGSHVGTMHQGF